MTEDEESRPGSHTHSPHRFNPGKLAANYAFLSGGEAAGKILTFAAFTFLARALGPADFGRLEFTLALTMFFSLAIDCGLASYGAREIARHPTRANTLNDRITSIRLLFAFGAFLLLLLVAALLGLHGPARLLLLLYASSLFALPWFYQWIFQGFEKMHWVSGGTFLRYLVFALGVFLFVRRDSPLWVVGLMEIAAVSTFALFNITVARSRFALRRPRLVLRFSRLCPAIRQALPIGLSELSWAFTFYFATIWLGILVGGLALGWFTAAHRCLMALHTFVWLYFFNLLPAISRCAAEPKEKLQELLRQSLRGTLWVAVFLASVGGLLAEPLIATVFGAQFRPAGQIFRILVWVLAIALWSGHYRYALIGLNRQRLEFLASASGGISSVVAALLLIPPLGATGAALSLVCAAAVHGGLAYLFVRQKITHVPFTAYAVRPVVTGAVSVVIFLLLLEAGPWLASLAAIGVYGSGLILLEPGILGGLRLALARHS